MTSYILFCVSKNIPVYLNIMGLVEYVAILTWHISWVYYHNQILWEEYIPRKNLLVADILQTTVQPSRKPLYLDFVRSVVFVVVEQKTRLDKILSQRLIATPAIRTLKISVFYPKNNQKSQISLVVGSRHTSDDSPTVTQIYHMYSYFFLVYCGGYNKRTKKK